MSHITPIDGVTLYKIGDYPALTIGRFSYIDGRGWILHYEELSPIRIGNFSAIATNVFFFMRANHRTEWATTYASSIMPWPEGVPKLAAPHEHGKGEIVIGSDVWVGEGVRFMPGVTVGHGAVIGAGTVVTKDVPPYALFAGNPGQVRKLRFSEADVAFLLGLRWWDRPTDEVRRLATEPPHTANRLGQPRRP